MCWEYEEKYTPCFDDFCSAWGMIDQKYGSPGNIIDFMENNWNMTISNKKEYEFTKRMFDFLSKLHEDKIIKPLGNPEDYEAKEEKA